MDRDFRGIGGGRQIAKAMRNANRYLGTPKFPDLPAWQRPVKSWPAFVITSISVCGSILGSIIDCIHHYVMGAVLTGEWDGPRSTLSVRTI